MSRPPEFLKSFADRIARAASFEAADQLVRMLRVSGLTGGDPERVLVSEIPRTFDASEPGVAPQQSRYIGIWERRVENGETCFVRRLEAIRSWQYWANVGRIEPRSTKLRVLFIGESVARGYVYDPSFTPAMALQMILDAYFGQDHAEVIDLARTNLGYEVRELALAALQLEPDLAIIFAGNNWGFSLPAFRDIADIERAITTGGMAGVKQVCDEYIARAVKTIVTDIAVAYKNSGVPLTWIIPEFNLGDWREPFTNAPCLPGDDNREWIATLEAARQAFAAGEFQKAEQLAARVVALDQGTCSAGYYLLADCRRAANDVGGRRKYLELARDAQSWDSSVAFIPKPYAVAQAVLREELPKYGVQLVDLPAVFKQYLNGEIPDARLFMDYCHLTSEGIRIAMGSAASCVLHEVAGVEQPWYTLVRDDVTPPPSIEAEALFVAAIHSAHRHQRYELVHHYCARALQHSAHVGEIMLNYIDLQLLNKAPARMSEAEETIFRLGSPLIHRYLFQKNNEKWFDRVLLTAIADALEEAGIPARERLESLQREEHSARAGETNLLHPFYQQSAGQPHEFENLCWPSERVDQDPQYFRAYWPESKFVFVGEAGYAVNLLLTCRLPQLSGDEGNITIGCNGAWLAEIIIGREWSAWQITVAAEIVHDGLNEIEIRWPMPEFRATEAFNDVIRRLCQMKYPEYYPTFGEIHSFVASSACPVSSTSPLAQLESSLAQVA